MSRKLLLEFSTLHMPTDAAYFGSVRFVKHDYGYLLFLGTKINTSRKVDLEPEWLQPFLRLAIIADARFINFDHGGEELASLPTHGRGEPF